MSYINKYFLPYISIPTLINGILLYHNPLLGTLSTAVTIIGIIYLLRIQNHLTFIQRILQFLFWTSLGWSAAWYEMYKFHSFYEQITQKNICITGIVTDYQHCLHMRNSHRITLSHLQIIQKNTTNLLQSTCFVYMDHTSIDQLYSIGSTLRLEKIHIKKPDDHFAQYLIKEGVFGTIFTSSDAITEIKKSSSWYSCIHTLRHSVFSRIQKKLPSHHFALFSALFLGNKLYNKKETEPIQDQFRIWGIAHIFARSGMHISIIINILMYLLFFIPAGHHLKILFVATASIIYTICSWTSVSFIRSFIMFILSAYGMLCKRYINPLHLLSLTTLLILIFHPLNLFFLDFQLSFALTGSLIWICTNITN
jgi:predicted membrane metal-binding protein